MPETTAERLTTRSFLNLREERDVRMVIAVDSTARGASRISSWSFAVPPVRRSRRCVFVRISSIRTPSTEDGRRKTPAI